MRLKVEINELTQEQWEQARKVFEVSYQFPDGASRVCLTVIHGDEESHTDVPVTALTGLLMNLTLIPAFKELSRAVKLAMAALTPDDDRLPADQPCGDVLGDGTCLVHNRHISACR